LGEGRKSREFCDVNPSFHRITFPVTEKEEKGRAGEVLFPFSPTRSSKRRKKKKGRSKKPGPASLPGGRGKETGRNDSTCLKDQERGGGGEQAFLWGGKRGKSNISNSTN